MKTYHLNDWTVYIKNKDEKGSYDVVCDGKTLVVIADGQDCFTFLKTNKNGTLSIEKLPYYVQYEFDSVKKCLYMTIL